METKFVYLVKFATILLVYAFIFAGNDLSSFFKNYCEINIFHFKLLYACFCFCNKL